MIKDEKKVGNPLAEMIFKVNFEKQVVTLILDNTTEEGEETVAANFDPVLKVDIDLTLSAQMNVQKYFEIKKKSHQKEVKTQDAAEVAIKQAEETAIKEINKQRQTQKIDKMRKIYWFEKFNWFISSENYLVLSGKDA